MADWLTDVFAGIGGGLSGMGQGLQWHQGMEMEKQKLDAETKRIQLQGEISKMLEEIRGSNAVNLANVEAGHRTDLQGLIQSGAIDLERLKQEGDAYLQELEGAQAITLEDRRQLGALTVEELRQAAETARNKDDNATSRANAQTSAGAHLGAARIGAASDEARTMMDIGSREKLFGIEFPTNTALKAYETEITAPRLGAGRTGRPAPSFGSFMRSFEMPRIGLPQGAPSPPPPAPPAVAPSAGGGRLPVNPRAPQVETPAAELARLVAAPLPADAQQRAAMAERIRRLRELVASGAGAR